MYWLTLQRECPTAEDSGVSSIATNLCPMCPWDVYQVPWPDLRTLISLKEPSSRVDSKVQARKWHRNWDCLGLGKQGMGRCLEIQIRLRLGAFQKVTKAENKAINCWHASSPDLSILKAETVSPPPDETSRYS